MKNKFQRGKQFAKIKYPFSWRMINFTDAIENAFENYYSAVWRLLVKVTPIIDTYYRWKELREIAKEEKRKQMLDRTIDRLKAEREAML